jgi:hypothetical protein
MVLLKPTYIIDGDITDIDLDHLLPLVCAASSSISIVTLLAPKTGTVLTEVKPGSNVVVQIFASLF